MLRRVAFQFFLNLSKNNRVSRCIHTSSLCPAKSFIEGENTFAHKLLWRLGNYNLMPSVVFPENELLPESGFLSPGKDISNSDLLSHLQSFAYDSKLKNITISDEKFDGIVDSFISRIQSFSDEELLGTLRILTIFPPVHSVSSRNFIEMWQSLEDECLKRLDRWSPEERLLACDHWYKLNMAKVSKFPLHATKRLGRNLKRLTPSQLVQTLFYVNMLRKPMVEMFEFEAALERVIDQLSIDEISVMAMGFFKTQTKLQIPVVVEKVFERLHKECLTLPDISLTAILKILRYSAKLPDAKKVTGIQQKLMPRIPELSLLSCLHLALLGTGFQCGDKECLNTVIRRYLKDYKDARLKDYERIAFTMALFDINTEESNELCRLILEEIPKRKEEIIKYKRCYPALLNYLSTCGHYNEELISVALSKQFYEAAYGQNLLLGRDIFCLDSFTRIEVPNYEGNNLTDRIRRNYAKLLCNYIPQQDTKYKLSLTDRMQLETKAALDSVYGPEFTVLENLLPHFERSEILMAFEKTTSSPVPIKSLHMPENYSGIILSRDHLLQSVDNREQIQTIVVVLGGFNSYIRGTETPTGVLRMKLEQTEKIGHKLVEVPYYDWQTKNPREREIYLKHKITRTLAEN